MALATDPEGMLWVGTMDAGLGRLDPATGGAHTYRHDAARPGSLAADAVMALIVDSVGDLWVGTYGGGLDRFDAATGDLRALPPRPRGPRDSLGRTS